jgi:hypothetical protein
MEIIFNLVLEEPMDKQTENTETTADSKVISLFSVRKAQAEAKADETAELKPEESAESFFDSMRKNGENAERLRKERLNANKSVLKSYRIKN